MRLALQCVQQSVLHAQANNRSERQQANERAAREGTRKTVMAQVQQVLQNGGQNKQHGGALAPPHAASTKSHSSALRSASASSCAARASSPACSPEPACRWLLDMALDMASP